MQSSVTLLCVFMCSLLTMSLCFHWWHHHHQQHQVVKHPAASRHRVVTLLHSSTQELLRETMELKNVSSIFLLNATRFGLDTALADGLKNLGDFEEAEQFAMEAIEIAQQTNQSDNIYAAYAERILGEVLFAEEKYREAAERFRHSLQSYVSHYNSKTGPENIEAVASGQLMSYILMKSEKYDEANRALRKELDRTKEVYGSESIQAADTMTNLATVLFYKNDFDESRAYYQRALAIYERLVAETSLPSNAEPLRLIYTCLGDINYIQGKDEDALNYYIKVEEMFFKSEKPEDLLSYIPAMKNLAMTHWRLDNADLAEPLFSRILDILKGHKKYGEGHSQTRVISEYLQRLNYGF